MALTRRRLHSIPNMHWKPCIRTSRCSATLTTIRVGTISLQRSSPASRISSMRTFDLARVSHDVLKTLYGTSDDTVLFWAHHEKLLVVDKSIAFMGGLDMC